MEIFEKMDINSIIRDPYIVLFVGGIIFYLASVFIFLDKIENKIKTNKQAHDQGLIKQYSAPLTVQSFIEIFDVLKENRLKYDKIQRLVDSIHWIGILFLVGSLLGFILEQANIKQDFAIGLMGSAFLYFFILLIYLIIWYRRN